MTHFLSIKQIITLHETMYYAAWCLGTLCLVKKICKAFVPRLLVEQIAQSYDLTPSVCVDSGCKKKNTFPGVKTYKYCIQQTNCSLMYGVFTSSCIAALYTMWTVRTRLTTRILSSIRTWQSRYVRVHSYLAAQCFSQFNSPWLN